MTVALDTPCTEQAYYRLRSAIEVIFTYPETSPEHVLRILRRAYVDAGVIARGGSDARAGSDSYGRHHKPPVVIECHDPPMLRLADG